MEKSREENIGIKISSVTFLSFLVSASGAVTGTIVFGRSFSEADIQSYLFAQRDIQLPFFEIFSGILIREFVFQGLCLLAGLFSFGWIFLFPLLIFGGLGTGIGVCCFCQELGWFGALYSFLVICVPFLCFSVSRSIICGELMKMSCGMFLCAAGRNSSGNHLKKLAIIIPLCGAIDILAAALAALMRMTLHPIIG